MAEHPLDAVALAVRLLLELVARTLRCGRHGRSNIALFDAELQRALHGGAVTEYTIVTDLSGDVASQLLASDNKVAPIALVPEDEPLAKGRLAPRRLLRALRTR